MLDTIQGTTPSNLIGAVSFSTDDVKGLRKFLQRNNVIANEVKGSPFGPAIAVKDPEDHDLVFVQLPDKNQPRLEMPGAYDGAITKWPRIIHAGFIVRDREKMEHFYKDILGFRPYWHGGMKDDETSWVSLQVPDGTDWLEFMLYDPTGKDKHFLGVMNHVALGVTDIQAAKAQLIKNGVKLTEEPKLGRDGKWQLNVYDPDDTRVEFMEFAPKEKPCCSEFTAPHPKP
ncbi:MAG: hypothetical protein NVS9B14_10830 [Candidatus Acidiferrum sp.]